uniref:Uncharacterized protein n=1 Tax=Arundo donax TaxID=35708 RepID=A0A0A9AT69_ARUDO
MQRPRSGG